MSYPEIRTNRVYCIVVVVVVVVYLLALMAASRFKNQSIYKNAFAQAPKREFWLQDVLAPNELNTLGHSIAASTRHMSFCWETAGTIALYPLNKIGRLQPPYSLLHAHSACVTDMEFSPFFEDILATAGEDKQVCFVVVIVIVVVVVVVVVVVIVVVVYLLFTG